MTNILDGLTDEVAAVGSLLEASDAAVTTEQYERESE